MKTNRLQLIARAFAFRSLLLFSFLLSAGTIAAQEQAAFMHAGKKHILDGNSAFVALNGGGGYTEVSAGMNYHDGDTWRASQDLIELDVNGAIARHGPIKVSFNANINRQGALEIRSAGGVVLKSHIAGLFLFSPATKRTIQIAALKDTIGELLPPNQVIYRDCFDGVAADVRYTYTKGAFEADVILRERVDPKAFGFPQPNCRIEVWTEFIDAPEPRLISKALQPDVLDDTLDFGDLLFIEGSAFKLVDEPRTTPNAPARIDLSFKKGKRQRLPIAKQWLRPDGRAFLIEAADLGALELLMAGLPPLERPAVLPVPLPREQLAAHLQSPLPGVAQSKPMRTARVDGTSPEGVVLDYITVPMTGNYTFQSGKTYYIDDTTSFGTVTIQANCVIKYTSDAYLRVNTAISSTATLAAPAVLTSMHDNLYGETIQGSSGNPPAEVTPAIWIYYLSTGTTLTGIKFRHLYLALKYDANAPVTHNLTDCRFEMVYYAFECFNASVQTSNLKRCGHAANEAGCPNAPVIPEDCGTGAAEDRDTDGLGDSWELTYFTSIWDQTSSWDPDGDGYSNLQELNMGTSPVQPNFGEPIGPSSKRTGIVISEIMYAPRTGVSEFIELYNSEPIPKRLDGWKLTLNNSTTIYQYGSTDVLQPNQYLHKNVTAGTLPDNEGTIRLLDTNGAVLLEVSYSDREPWPAAASGPGHSLVLWKPSYGEGDPRAWTASDAIDGTPGAAEVWHADPLRSIVINEFLANPGATGSPEDYIELYNHNNQDFDITGCCLTPTPGSLPGSPALFQIPPMIIPARGFVTFVRNAPGSFTFDISPTGDALFLLNPARTRVYDAVRFTATASARSMGRSPDGSPGFIEQATESLGDPNSPASVHDVVINEIMFNPMPDPSSTYEAQDFEYIELHNRGTTSVPVGGWRIRGIGNFQLPATTIPAGGYRVIPRNRTALLQRYPSIAGVTINGSYSPSDLSNRGEEITLFNANNGVVIDRVSYFDGGRWGKWADGGGASLQLLDPNSDNRQPSNWADSPEPTAAGWTTIEVVNGTLERWLSGVPINTVEITLLGEGECLLDDVEVIFQTINIVPNGNFTANATGWTFEGNHDRTSWMNSGGFNDPGCLRLRADGRGHYLGNRIAAQLNTTLTPQPPPNPPTYCTLRARVRWLRGWPEILVRLRGNCLEATGRMSIPYQALGTPGSVNTGTGNTGPAIWDVTHFPVAPSANQPVYVTARVQDPNGIALDLNNVPWVQLRYRQDPSSLYTSISMRDDGSKGDFVANDGVYTAILPAKPAGTLLSFYVQAIDNAAVPVTTTFPAPPAARECFVRFGDPALTGTFATYRMWMSSVTNSQWASRNALHNGLMNVTFVLGNHRAIYNAGAAYSGGPSTSLFYTSPTTGTLCGYTLGFPNDEPFLGARQSVLEWPYWDFTGQRETLAYWMANQLGLPVNHHRYVHFYANGVSPSSRPYAYSHFEAHIYKEVQQPEADFLEQYFPGTSGELYKLEVLHAAHSFVNGSGVQPSGNPQTFASLQRFLTAAGQKHTPTYRWTWLKRAIQDSANNFNSLFQLVDAVNYTGWDYIATVESKVDVEQWMRVLALERVIGNRDVYWNWVGHNLYAYLPGPAAKWQLLLYDLELTFGAASDCPTDGLFGGSNQDPTITTMMNRAAFRRAYWRAFKEAVDGPMLSANYGPIASAYYTALAANGVIWNYPPYQPGTVQPVANADEDMIQYGCQLSLNEWMTARRNFIVNELNSPNVSAPFVITTLGGENFSTYDDVMVLEGTSPILVQKVRVNGDPNTWLEWPDDQMPNVTRWNVGVFLNPGENYITVSGYDRGGLPVPGAEDTIVITRLEF